MSFLGDKSRERWSVLGAELGLADRYETLVLARHSDQIADLDPAGADTLVVFSDWLSWVEWRRRGGAGVPAESFLAEWPDQLGDPDRVFQRGTAWMMVDGKDVTLFHGVSLGKQFNWILAGVWHAHTRLEAALDAAIRRFRPAKLVYRGLRAEYEFLGADLLKTLARRVAAAHCLAFLDEERPSPAGPYPELPFDGEHPPVSFGRKIILRTVELVLDGMTRLAAKRLGARRRVLVIHNLICVTSLLDSQDGLALQPLLIGRHHPKRRGFLAKIWRSGAHLAALPAARLDADDRRRLAEIRRSLTSAWTQPGSPAVEAQRAFAARHVLAPGALEAKAIEVKRFVQFFARHRPNHIVVGDSENHLVRLVAELARARAISVDELLNGMFVTRQRMDSRTGDGNHPPVIDRLLAWGPANERWLKATQAPIACTQTGYPVIDMLKRSIHPPAPGLGRALILPLHVDRADVAGLFGEVFSQLVETVRAVQAAGYADIRVKVHPGFINLPYYQAVLDHFDLRVTCLKDGPLLPHIHWCDIVVGPVNSGALVETLAVGRPYYPLLCPPTSFDPALYHPIAPLAGTAELGRALDQKRSQTAEPVLREIGGYNPQHPAAAGVWSAIATRLGARV